MFVRLSYGVRHHHEQASLNFSVRPPTLFAILDAVFQRHEQRISKHFVRIFEADVVLALVGEVFGLIPFEPDT